MLACIAQEGWSAAGHDAGQRWYHVVGQVTPWILFAVLIALVVRALLLRHRYRALEVFGEAEQHAVREAVIAAERRTVGEIVPVVLERSDAHPQANWVAALLLLVLGSGLLAGFLPWNRPELLLICQLGLAGVGFGLARILPAFQRLFVSDARAAGLCAEQALQEFYRLGLHRTERATGVLILVSLLEHRVVVLGDEGISTKVGEAHWPHVREAVLSGIRRGSLRDGLIEGIRLCGEELARHFPWAEGDRNELPDRVIVRRE